jgi:hypothetical protein
MWLQGQWTARNAGGCSGHPTFHTNPQFRLTSPMPGTAIGGWKMQSTGGAVKHGVEVVVVVSQPLPAANTIGFYLVTRRDKRFLSKEVTFVKGTEGTYHHLHHLHRLHHLASSTLWLSSTLRSECQVQAAQGRGVRHHRVHARAGCAGPLLPGRLCHPPFVHPHPGLKGKGLHHRDFLLGQATRAVIGRHPNYHRFFHIHTQSPVCIL